MLRKLDISLRPEKLIPQIETVFMEQKYATENCPILYDDEYVAKGDSIRLIRDGDKLWDILRSIPKGLENNALDIGCAMGMPLLYLKQLGWNVYGVSAGKMSSQIKIAFKKEFVEPLLQIQEEVITTNAETMFNNFLIIKRQYRLITAFKTWMYFQDPLGTLVATYNKLLATDGFLIIEDLDALVALGKLPGPDGLGVFYQILSDGGYSFVAFDGLLFLKKTALKRELELPYYYSNDSRKPYLLPDEFIKKSIYQQEEKNQQDKDIKPQKKDNLTEFSDALCHLGIMTLYPCDEKFYLDTLLSSVSANPKIPLVIVPDAVLSESKQSSFGPTSPVLFSPKPSQEGDNAVKAEEQPSNLRKQSKSHNPVF